MARPPGGRAPQPIHEQRAVGQPRQRIVKRIVEQPFLRAAQAGAHLVERHRHRGRFRAARDRHLAVPIARRNFSGGRGDRPERLAHAPAEHEPAAERQHEDDDAGVEQFALQRVEELLSGPPILEQHETIGIVGRSIPQQRKRPLDIPFSRQTSQARRHAERRRSGAAVRKGGDQFGPRVALQTASAQCCARHEAHLAVRRLRELFGDGVVECVADGHGPEDLFGEPSRFGHRRGTADRRPTSHRAPTSRRRRCRSRRAVRAARWP